MTGKAEVLQMMDEAGAVYLATLGMAGPRIRGLVNLRRRDLYPAASEFCRRQGFTVYFTTSGNSNKVAELRANPAAAAYYSDPARTRGIELSGQVDVLTDRDLKNALWCDQWRIYWPAGPDEPDYVVLRLKPVRAAGWWGTAPFTLDPGAE